MLHGMIFLSIFVNNKRGRGKKSTTFFHSVQESPSFFYIGCSKKPSTPDYIEGKTKQIEEPTAGQKWGQQGTTTDPRRCRLETHGARETVRL